LVGGPFNTLNNAEAGDDLARRDAPLDEVRALARTYPDLTAVPELHIRTRRIAGCARETTAHPRLANFRRAAGTILRFALGLSQNHQRRVAGSCSGGARGQHPGLQRCSCAPWIGR
jgi:hypothetical protein